MGHRIHLQTINIYSTKFRFIDYIIRAAREIELHNMNREDSFCLNRSWKHSIYILKEGKKPHLQDFSASVDFFPRLSLQLLGSYFLFSFPCTLRTVPVTFRVQPIPPISHCATLFMYPPISALLQIPVFSGPTVITVLLVAIDFLQGPLLVSNLN
jgi:hypothetical protein